MYLWITTVVFISAFLLTGNGARNRFCGGALSFRFIDTETSSHVYKVELTAITAWVLGQGPCGSGCSTSDVGRNTHKTRSKVIEDEGPDVLGSWKREINLMEADITPLVSSIMEGRVLAINEEQAWEEEIATFVLDMNTTDSYTDVSLFGNYWRDFDYAYTRNTQYHLQVKIKPGRRNDTGQPNNSPIAMFKPVYRIPLNQRSSIRLSVTDSDGDSVQCRLGMFVEAGGLTAPPQVTVNKDCTVEINAVSSEGYYDKGWGAVPLSVVDYNTNVLSIEGDSAPYRPVGAAPLSVVGLQLMIQTLETISIPAFVSPTFDSQHMFDVYAESSLQIPLYAKPSSSGLSLRFNVRSVPHRVYIIPPAPEADPDKPTDGVMFVLATWNPRQEDVGSYVVGAIVDDKNGDADRNYNVRVRSLEMSRNLDPVETNTPYLAYTPKGYSITCRPKASCTFPVFASAGISTYEEIPEEITSVHVVTSTFAQTAISQMKKVSRQKDIVWKADITVISDVAENQQICIGMKNTRNHERTECLLVYIGENPCESNNCSHGRCVINNNNYTCACLPGFIGTNCDEVLEQTDQDDTLTAIVAPAVSVPVAVASSVAAVFAFKKCAGKCSLKNLVENAPTDKLTSVELGENEESDSNDEDDDKEKKAAPECEKK